MTAGQRGAPSAPGTVGEVREQATELLVAAGVPRAEASRTAWAIVLADCWDLGSHGMMRLPHYLRRLRAGGCRAHARLRMVADTGPLVSFDGEDGLGHWQLWRAAELASERCAEHGVGVAAVGRSSHCGALGVYTLPFARAGHAGLVFSHGPAVMPPTGGSSPVVSTSPIAAGFPDGERPAIVDLATSAVARGKIAQRAVSGEPLPPGWAYDAEGAATVDAAAALRGMLAPLGGAKGFALAFLVEALTGAMVGPALSTQVVDMFAPADSARPQRIGHLVVALDPARTAVDGGAADRLRALTELVRDAGGRAPGDRRALPDEIADDMPLTLPSALCVELREWAARLGL